MTRHVAIIAVAVVGSLLGGCAAFGADSDDFVTIPGLGETRIDVPRPTSGQGAGCVLHLPVGETVTERVTDLRTLGLFADRHDLSDVELGRQVAAAIATTWGSDIGPDDPLLDLFVAEQDHSRTWWHDLESDVTDGNHVYETTLAEWAAISSGAFAPSAVHEAWASETGPVSVTFEMSGATHDLAPQYLEDWIDPGIAEPINELIAPSGRQFTFLQSFDQTAFLMALTPDERAALEARGWCFG